MQIRCRCSWLLGLVSNRKQHWRQHTSDRLTCQRRAKLPWGLKRMKETQFQRTGSETWRAQSCAKPLDSTQGTNSHTSTQTICTITHTHKTHMSLLTYCKYSSSPHRKTTGTITQTHRVPRSLQPALLLGRRITQMSTVVHCSF